MRTLFRVAALAAALVCTSVVSPAEAQVVGPVPVFQFDRAASGSIAAAGPNTSTDCTGTGCVKMQAPGSGEVHVDVAGTWVATLTFQGTIDGTNWFSIEADPKAGGAASTSTSANGRFRLSHAGLLALRVNATAYTSGTATVVLEASGLPGKTLSTPAASAFAGGALPFFNDAVAGTVVQIKASAGQIYSLKLLNTTAAAAYLQIFCKPSASVTLGTTAADFVIRMAASESGAPISFPVGVTCSSNTGLSVAGTTTATGSTGAAISVAATYL